MTSNSELIERLRAESKIWIGSGTQTGENMRELLHDCIEALSATKPAPAAEPVVIHLGDGVIGVHPGTHENVPCLALTTLGAGAVGEPSRHPGGETMLSDMLAVIRFGSRESFEVFAGEVDEVRKAHFPISQPPPQPVGVDDEARFEELLQAFTLAVETRPNTWKLDDPQRLKTKAAAEALRSFFKSRAAKGE